MPRSQNIDDLPRDFSEELETDDLIKRLELKKQRLMVSAYPARAHMARDIGITHADLRSALDTIHRDLARMLDQRRCGDPINPNVRKKRQRAKIIKINNHKAAAVAE